MAKELTVQVAYWRTIKGCISRLGDEGDYEGTQTANSYTPGTEVRLIAANCYHQMTANQRAWKNRVLFEIDLSGVPRNSYIQSCLLRMRKKDWVTTLRADGATEQATFTLAMYKAEAKPWNQSAILANYDGTNPWTGNGMIPNQDYYAVGALRTDEIAKATHVAGENQDFDLTTFARECMDRDDQKMRIVWKAEEAWELANLYGRWFQDMYNHEVIGFYGPTEYEDVTRRPKAIISYTEPLAFFASQQDGTVDLGREIFLGAGQMRIGSVVHSVTDISYQETPAKIWLKNQLANTTMRNVEVLSPPNWATHPTPDPANAGNGTCADVSTSQTLTIDEQWKVEFTAATAFTVYRDSGTGDIPGGSQQWTQDGTGNTGTLYTSATRGISFTITVGGTPFVSGDKFTWRTYKDYSITGAAADADMLLQLSKDQSGSPDGNWYHARTAMTTLSQSVVSDATLPVANARYFNPANKVKIYDRSTRAWSQEYTIQSVNRATNEIEINAAVSYDQGDWVFAVVPNFGDISPGGTKAFWARGMSFTDTVKQEKYQYLKARENI